MPQIDINNPNLPGILPEIDINKIPSIRDIGKKKPESDQIKDEDAEKHDREKYRCPWCGGFH